MMLRGLLARQVALASRRAAAPLAARPPLSPPALWLRACSGGSATPTTPGGSGESSPGDELLSFKVLAGAEVDDAAVRARLQQRADAVRAQEWHVARAIKEELLGMGVVPEPWRFDAEAAEYELPAAELEALTAQVEPLLAARARWPCEMRAACEAAAGIAWARRLNGVLAAKLDLPPTRPPPEIGMAPTLAG